MSKKGPGEDIDIVPGDIVSGLDPSDLVEIRRIAPFGIKTLIEGIGVQSRLEIKRPLTIEELSVLIKIRGKVHSFKGDPGIFLLGSEAERIRIAHQFDPLFAVNSSMVVVDEAHKLSAYEYGSKLEESDRYKAIKTLAKKTDHLLFLTATPHRGRKDTFRRLLLLLDEDLFQKDEHSALSTDPVSGRGG